MEASHALPHCRKPIKEPETLVRDPSCRLRQLAENTSEPLWTTGLRAMTDSVDLLSPYNSPEDIAAKTTAIRQAVLRESDNLKQPNFECVSTEDLARLFGLYDRTFFKGLLAQAVKAKTGQPLAFRLSSTMTRSGGKTILYRRRMPSRKVQANYEIAVASRMLFMTFKQVDRPVVVCGLTCKDRLEALHRIMEHEIIHLVELVIYGKSSCSARRFKELAANVFGHAGTTHALVTPGEHAAQYGIRVGSTVCFEFEGRRLIGRVNRVNRRATVLVEDAKGPRYSDGKNYHKFYMPLKRLSPASV